MYKYRRLIGFFYSLAILITLGRVYGVDTQEEFSSVVGTRNLTTVWSRKGAFSSLAIDNEQKEIFAFHFSGKVIVFSVDGREKRRFKIGKQAGEIRCANLIGDDKNEILIFKTFPRTLLATDGDGRKLWEYEKSFSICDVWPTDLNNDGKDEVAIGYSGTRGIHVLDNKGKKLWKHKNIYNVWHICGGDLTGDCRPEIIASSASGKVYIFNGRGKNLKTLRPNCYANMVRLAKPDNKNENATILVGGHDKEKKPVLIALDIMGKQKWSRILSNNEKDNIHTTRITCNRPWAVVGLSNGDVKVIDIITGKQIVKTTAKNAYPAVAWYEPQNTKDAPLLIVAAGERISVFQVEQRKPTTTKQAND